MKKKEKIIIEYPFAWDECDDGEKKNENTNNTEKY